MAEQASHQNASRISQWPIGQISDISRHSSSPTHFSSHRYQCRRAQTREPQTSLLRSFFFAMALLIIACIVALGNEWAKYIKDCCTSTPAINHQQQPLPQYCSSSNNNQAAASNATNQTSALIDEPLPPYQQYAPPEPDQQGRARSKPRYQSQRLAVPNYQ